MEIPATIIGARAVTSDFSGIVSEQEVIAPVFGVTTFASNACGFFVAQDLGVSTDEVIALALLLGSDYTEGVKGVGIVNAMEVLYSCDSLFFIQVLERRYGSFVGIYWEQKVTSYLQILSFSAITLNPLQAAVVETLAKERPYVLFRHYRGCCDLLNAVSTSPICTTCSHLGGGVDSAVLKGCTSDGCARNTHGRRVRLANRYPFYIQCVLALP